MHYIYVCFSANYLTMITDDEDNEQEERTAAEEFPDDKFEDLGQEEDGELDTSNTRSTGAEEPINFAHLIQSVSLISQL